MFVKNVSSYLEIELQTIAANYGFAPRIHHADGDVIQMEAIKGHCLADLYTDDPKKVPDWIWEEIFRILTVLYECEGIEYIDITSYNFMLDEANKVWIIDFGDAYYTPKEKATKEAKNWFLKDVLNGLREWNPDFA
jgi:RIO-like serine/threonine protein kinase